MRCGGREGPSGERRRREVAGGRARVKDGGTGPGSRGRRREEEEAVVEEALEGGGGVKE